MTPYKHMQIGYLMTVVTVIILVFFMWLQITARAEFPSVDSGANFAVTVIMVLILFFLVSFTTLTVSINDDYLRIKFGFGIFAKKFALDQIVSVQVVKNRWYHGWGIRLWLWPYMWIYNISGFDAIEIQMKNGRIYRIGTDDPSGLETAIEEHKGKLVMRDSSETADE